MTNKDDPSGDDVPWQWTEDEWEEVYSRPRGILTDVDRKFLWGVRKYDTAPQRSERRAEIRSRVKNALLDLFYLPEMEPDQRERVFAELEEESGSWGLHESIGQFVQFLFHGVGGDTKRLEEAIKHGIWKAQGDLKAEDDATWYRSGNGLYAGIDVDITIDEGHNVDRLEKRLNSRGADSLTDTELGILVREERIAPEDMEDLHSSHPTNPLIDGPPSAPRTNEDGPPPGVLGDLDVDDEE